MSVTIDKREYLSRVQFMVADRIAADQLTRIDVVPEYLRELLNLLLVVSSLVKIPREWNNVVFDAPHIA